ncbi:MAG: carnitine 3-dehydrogenase, partial [Octadecabacter sp.]
MLEEDRLLATGEHMMIHVSLASRKASDPAPSVAGPLAKLANAHAKLPRPEAAGAAVGVR